MHESLEQVLKAKDLAKSGDLFSVSDEDIVKDCSRYIICFPNHLIIFCIWD